MNVENTTDDIEFQKRLKLVSNYWNSFYEQLEKWTIENDLTINDNWRQHSIKYDIARNNAIKNHISSTHTWIKGPDHWSKKIDNWFSFPFECKVCKMGASDYEEVYDEHLKINLKTGDLPSHDMHNNYITRTCEEVQLAKKRRKGKKCIQCGTYGCINEF